MSYIKEPNRFITPWTAAIPFYDDLHVFEPLDLTAGITFTIATTPKTPGSVSIYRLKGNGVIIPAIDPAIVRVATSLNFNKAAGTINTLQAWWDGGGAWYQWVRGEASAGSGLVAIGMNFTTNNANFTTPAANTYSSSNATAFSGSGGSSQAIPAGKSGQVTFLLGSATLVGLHSTTSQPSVAGGAPPWRYYLWNAGGTLFTGESGSATASLVTGVTGPRYVQLRRVGSIVSAWHKVALTDPWLPVVTYAVSAGTALFVMLGTTAGNTVQVLALEVEP